MSHEKKKSGWFIGILLNGWKIIPMYGCFLKWWYPQNTPKWSFLVGKPMVVGYHPFRNPIYLGRISSPIQPKQPGALFSIAPVVTTSVLGPPASASASWSPAFLSASSQVNFVTGLLMFCYCKLKLSQVSTLLMYSISSKSCAVWSSNVSRVLCLILYLFHIISFVQIFIFLPWPSFTPSFSELMLRFPGMFAGWCRL